jgi:OmpA-OmpF porin, OOP family
MNRLWVATAMFIILAWPMGALAQERAGIFTLTPFAGAYLFEGGEFDDGPIVGMGLGYALTDRWHVEGSLGAIFSDSDQGGDTLGLLYRVEGLYHFRRFDRFVPFLAAGVGGITYDYDEGGDDTYLLFDYGGGVKYSLTERIAVRGDLRHVILSEDEPRHNLLATVGLSFSFGGPREEVRPVETAAPPDPLTPREEPLVTEEIPEEELLTRDVCLILPVFFDFDRTAIKPEDEETLKRVAEFINAHPEIESAMIRGHTDAIGTESYNLDLSIRRAESVKRYLVENYGLDPSFFETVGYGKSQPSALNITPEGRAQNRRAVTVTCYVQDRQEQ